jgi:hypothetical protein
MNKGDIMIDLKDINHMIVLLSAWIMTNVSVILAVIIMVLQIYILVLKIKKMKDKDRP